MARVECRNVLDSPVPVGMMQMRYRIWGRSTQDQRLLIRVLAMRFTVADWLGQEIEFCVVKKTSVKTRRRRGIDWVKRTEWLVKDGTSDYGRSSKEGARCLGSVVGARDSR